MDTMFGTDPEVFLFDNKNNTIVPPAALKEDYGINYSKKTIIEGSDWKIIEDGAATEINVEPSNDSSQLFKRIQAAISGLNVFGNKHNLIVLIKPSVPFSTNKYWIGRGESFRDCVRFGCDPDLDIYSGKYSSEISVPELNLRFGGGHIHMQAPEKEQDLYEDVFFHVTRLMDILVGNTCVALARDESLVSKEKERLQFYGRPGKIRLQNYPNGKKGIEYRVPSNFWINNPYHYKIIISLMNAVFNLSQHPEDASKFLSPAYCDSAPENILFFKEFAARDLALEVVDTLTSMKYTDIETLTSLYSHVVKPKVKKDGHKLTF